MILTKPFDTKLIPLKAFENARSYEAAVFGVEMMNSVLKLKKEGWLIMEDGKIIDPGFEVTYTENTFHAYGREYDGQGKTKTCRIFFIGDVTNDEGKAYVTKKDMREWFKRYRFVRKRDIRNLLKV